MSREVASLSNNSSGPTLLGSKNLQQGLNFAKIETKINQHGSTGSDKFLYVKSFNQSALAQFLRQSIGR